MKGGKGEDRGGSGREIKRGETKKWWIERERERRTREGRGINIL